MRAYFAFSKTKYSFLLVRFSYKKITGQHNLLRIKAEILEAVSKKRSVILPAFNTRHSCLQRHHSHGAVLHLRNSLTVVVALAERADICLKACAVKFYSPFWMPSSHPSFLSSHTAQDGCSLDEKWASSEWLPSWRRIMPAEQSLPALSCPPTPDPVLL